MRLRYPQAQNRDMDEDDDQHNLVPGAWRANNPLLPVRGPEHLRGNELAKHQREYLMSYYDSPAGAVTWQWNRV